MMAALQEHLFAGGRAAESLHDAFLSRKGSPSTFLTGAAGDEIMKIGGWDGVDIKVQNRDHFYWTSG